jgi:tRNA(Ile)-lysidine synthase
MVLKNTEWSSNHRRSAEPPLKFHPDGKETGRTGKHEEKVFRKQGDNDINNGMKSRWKRDSCIVAVSGGADSVYLLVQVTKETAHVVMAHYNHRARGKDSEEDERFVKTLCRKNDLCLEVGRPPSGCDRSSGGKDKRMRSAGFEARARRERYRFLYATREKYGANKILVAHTADDQVETVLMRILEGAGITGLKGIPRSTEKGIERPLLDTWREDIVRTLKKKKIPFRVDKSNLDTRFERNWVRHVLLPLLETRYGKSVRKRIFALGERFREIDAYIEQNARKWIHMNRSAGKTGGKVVPGKRRRATGASGTPAAEVEKNEVRFLRKAYAALPSVLRIRILQILCFEWIGTEPNERLLVSMDRLIVSGGSSARLNVGRGATLRCRYGEAILSPSGEREKSAAGHRGPARTGKGKPGQSPSGKEPGRKAWKGTGTPEPLVRMEGPGLYRWNAGGPHDDDVPPGSLRAFQWKEQGKIASGRIRRLAEGEQWVVFDGGIISFPLFIRSLRVGDRIRPFGLDSKKKVKEIFIDRKVPRDERWGRPVVCDANGEILWIPGVVRSAHAPVTPRTRRTIVLRAEIAEGTSS